MEKKVFFEREVSRLLNVMIALGWELIEELPGDRQVIVTLRLVPSDALLKSLNGIGPKISP